MARVREAGGHGPLTLEAWEVGSVAPGAHGDPRSLDGSAIRWIPARAPGTVAAAMRGAGERSGDFDRLDWWYRCRFDAPAPQPGRAAYLELGGLATVADVWLNGTHLLRSDSMFHEHRVDVSRLLRGSNEIAIRFLSLQAMLATKRPRGRFRTSLVDQQQLRWFRTTLLGRIGGWTPPIDTVGPWRPIVLTVFDGLAPLRADVRTRVDGTEGVALVALQVRVLGAVPSVASLRVGASEVALAVKDLGDGVVSLEGELRIPEVALWWPRSHGPSPLHAASLHARAGGKDFTYDCGRLGFRTIEADTGDGGFGLRVNGEAVFCRGACWTTLDPVSLTATPAAHAEALDAAALAGMNMIRVGGTMLYEDDAFYDACSERGLLVWQDFMFANMDYPAEDPAFRASVEREANQFVSRVQACPALAVLCGNTEVAQQAAMLGLPRAVGTSSIFEDTLPTIVRDFRPDVPYWPSTPSGGVLPFHVDAGVAHYYGVGAYRRPLEDARRSGVRFTAECLGFSHVPDEATIELVLGGGQSPFHHPAWKAGVPRDAGAGWDFEDVRDHYLALLHGPDAPRLRQTDMPRYLALSRVVTGEVTAHVLAEWRRGGSTCRGALLWFLRDLVPGAGWGLLDSTGRPKAAYYFVRRVLQPVALLMTDEGLNGLALHAVNDGPEAIEAEIEISLYRHGGLRVASGRAEVMLEPRKTLTVSSDALLEHFLDVTYAYRFGPNERDVVVGELRPRGGGPSSPSLASLGKAFHFPMGHAFARERDLGLEAWAEPTRGGAHLLHVRTKTFAQAVAIDVRDHALEDNYFHLEPGAERAIEVRPLRPGASLAGSVQALNATDPVRIVVQRPGERGTAP